MRRRDERGEEGKRREKVFRMFIKGKEKEWEGETRGEKGNQEQEGRERKGKRGEGKKQN
jgi:hypothetical protein